MRLFVAVLLPEAWREYLASVAARLERASPGYARWVAPDSLHLTLVFLGSQVAAQQDAIVAACGEAAADVQRFELGLAEAGFFGPRSGPRVVWMDVVDRPRTLPGLHQRLTAALKRQAIRFDERPLVPHVTLGRARREASREQGQSMASALTSLGPRLPSAPPIFTVEGISLMRSELSSRGARYTELARAELGR